MVTFIQDWREKRQVMPPLSAVEWKVVEAAHANSMLSVNPDGLLARVARAFGIQVEQGLADKRLEALRRFSVRAWHWDLIRDKDLRAFLDAGFTRLHVLDILSRLGSVRGFTPSIEYEAMPHFVRSAHHSRVCG